MPGTRTAVKRLVLGRPRSSRELTHQLLPKWMALPVFSSDPLSSVAYATQEMMLVLVLAGAGALALVGPLSLGVAALLAVVVVSYRQTVRAYPHGGGAYIVARDNLGDRPGLLAAGALLVDYVLTVAVSIAAGVAAAVAAVPALDDYRLPLALAVLAVVTTANLRGAREAGLLFALPTYAFVVTMLALVVVGVARCGAGIGGCPPAPSAGAAPDPAQALTLFLVLRAFASGAAALTGVEAISNGVPAFRYPQSRNAATTLGVMGALAVTLFAGISYLARATGVVPAEGMPRTVVAQVAEAVFGPGPGFYLVQVVTAAILVLAANTAYADFPRLASVLARDRWLPRQFLARGDRLVFSNGILLLALAAALLLSVYRADVTELVQLYVVGVFTAFTLSQAGMVRFHLRMREPGWQRSCALNAVGGATTALVLVVVVVAKFVDGAWLVVAGIPLLAWMMSRIHRHYRTVSLLLRRDVAAPEPARPNHMVLVLERVDEAAARALSYCLSTQPATLRALAVPRPGSDVPRRWAQLAREVPLEVLGEGAGGAAQAVRRRLHEDAASRAGGSFTTAVIAEHLSRSWFQQLRGHRLALRLKTMLLDEAGLVVTSVTSPEGGPGPYTIEEPVEHHVVVLVSAVNSATLRTVAYAKSLHPTTLRALSVNLDPERTTAMLVEWEDWSIDVPIDLVDSPYRSLVATVRSYIRDLAPDGRHTVVTCVLPEFVLGRLRHQPLHNQSALLLKAGLLFERGVVTTSVPYQLRLDQPREGIARWARTRR